MSNLLLGLGLALALVLVGIAGLTQGSTGAKFAWVTALVLAAIVALLFLLALGGVLVLG